MSGNEIETFQKISDFIDSFDSTSLGSIIILAILVCVVLVSVFKSIYSTSVEELFMNSKEKNKNMFFQLLVILTILIFINFMLLNIALIFMEILLGAVSLVVYIVYQRKENGTRKYLEMIDELNTYYKQRSSFWYLISIICLIPSLVFLINSIENSIPLFNCAVITSVIEVSIICIIMPEYIMYDARNYFVDNENKFFIYGRIEDDIVLCGDNTQKSKASKYITISYEDLQKKEIFHMRRERLSKKRKRELRTIYKENKQVNEYYQ